MSRCFSSRNLVSCAICGYTPSGYEDMALISKDRSSDGRYTYRESKSPGWMRDHGFQKFAACGSRCGDALAKKLNAAHGFPELPSQRGRQDRDVSPDLMTLLRQWAGVWMKEPLGTQLRDNNRPRYHHQQVSSPRYGVTKTGLTLGEGQLLNALHRCYRQDDFTKRCFLKLLTRVPEDGTKAIWCGVVWSGSATMHPATMTAALDQMVANEKKKIKKDTKAAVLRAALDQLVADTTAKKKKSKKDTNAPVLRCGRLLENSAVGHRIAAGEENFWWYIGMAGFAAVRPPDASCTRLWELGLLMGEQVDVLSLRVNHQGRDRGQRNIIVTTWFLAALELQSSSLLRTLKSLEMLSDSNDETLNQRLEKELDLNQTVTQKTNDFVEALIDVTDMTIETVERHLEFAASCRPDSILEKLLSRLVDAQGKYCGAHGVQSLLHEVIRSGCRPSFIEKVRTTLGADLFIRNDDPDFGNEMTPIMTAVCCDPNGGAVEQVIPYLVSKGVDINAKNSKENGGTALHMFLHEADYCNSEWLRTVIGAFKAAGADLDAVDDNGDTPLHYAGRIEPEDEESSPGDSEFLDDELDWEESELGIAYPRKYREKLHKERRERMDQLSYGNIVSVASILLQHGARLGMKNNKGEEVSISKKMQWTLDTQ